MQQLADTRTTLHIRHHYAAPQARVFDAWLSPQLAGLWLFATASRPMVNVTIDARSGGAFCLVERRAGAVIEHRGRYVEILRPQRLVFMLHSKDCAPKEVPLGGAPHATRVTAVFTAQDRTCMLELMHEDLPADHAAHMEARWTGMLYGLGVVLTGRDSGERL
ncbi:MAG: SRPBCC domain-containing protein [Burkholderiales bacterium]|jgi:uncharacterized protein YndB with AHSA1/START domain|nr:SRPBCC domain-containing protein [Burkholderiales bacterium]